MRRRRLATILLIGFAILIVLIWVGRRREPAVAQGSALVVDLSGKYVEAPEPSWISRLLGRDSHSFLALNSLLAKAERDPRIDTVVFRIDSLGMGWGKAQELRGAIRRLHDAGRKTVAYLELQNYSANVEYYVASAADRVVLPPGGAAPVVGLAAEYLYLGGLWQKLGVSIDVEKVGRYKSATETIAGEKMSDAARVMANSLLDSIDDQFVAGVAEGRHLDAAKVRAAIDAGPVIAGELEGFGLIDGTAHLSELLEPFGDRVVKGQDYAAVSPESVGFHPVARLALVYASGSVVMGEGSAGRSGEPVAASRTVSQALLDAADDDSIAGVILRVDSPGGSALASEMIWNAVAQVRKKGKPVIASFSDVAASGGYYLSAGANTIVSPAGTYTGSIGVFALRPVVGGLLDKLGINVESLTRGKHADFLLSSEPLSPGARDRLHTLVVDTYDLFVRRVSEGRQMPTDKVDAVAQGRVWTGAQGLEVGLVDEIGGLHEALAAARRECGIAEGADVALVLFPRPQPLAVQIAQALHFARASLVPRLEVPLPVSRAARTLEAWLVDTPTDGPLLLPPLAVEIR